MSTIKDSGIAFDLDDDMPEFAGDDERWEAFESNVRRKLGISGREFLRKVDSGEIVNDDRDAGVTLLFMLCDGLTEAQRQR